MINKSCTLSVLIAFVLLSSVATAQELKPVSLPEPQTDGGKPLMQTLKARNTSREIKPDKLPLQVLSNLLWAAFGINRPESGKRTAPSAMNWQEIDIYVALADGLYVYDAKAQGLNPVLAADVRGATGTQDFVKDAPVNLVYVADLARTGDASADAQNLYTAVDTGVIVQNVYLFCASEGLGTVFRGAVDYAKLGRLMRLGEGQFVTFAQTVGYPAT